MPSVSLKLSTPGVWDFSYTTELAQLLHNYKEKLIT